MGTDRRGLSIEDRMDRLEVKFDRLIWSLVVAGFCTTSSLLFFALQTLASAHAGHS